MDEAVPFSWLSVYPDGVRVNLEYPDEPLTAFLERSASRYPQHTATIFFGRRITYQKLWDSVERFAAGLDELGIEKGDRVAVMLPNCPQAVISYYGILRIGAVVVPINPVNVERELVQQLRDVNCKMIVYLDSRHSIVHPAREDAGIELAVVTGLQDYMPHLAAFNYRYRQARLGKTLHAPTGAGLERFCHFLDNAPPRAPEVVIQPKEDLSVLQFTGGTTGTPKAAMLTHFNLLANTLQNKEWYVGCQEGKEVFLAVLPFSMCTV